MNDINWTIFLGKLDENNEFDENLKKYLEALKYVSEISIKSIDEPKEREKINDNLIDIVGFIQKYSENYHELSLIKGFKTNDKLANGSWRIDGRDYYYYIADQKMKASVYYVRYLNYIDKHLNNSDVSKQKLEEIITKVKDIVAGDVDVSDKNIVGIIDELSLTTEGIKELRQSCVDYIKCVEYINQIRSNEMQYLKYMLFNNMMREVRYIGAAYQYLWHWLVKTKNLFRYVSYDGKEMTLDENTSKKIFLEDMFNKVISHMNKSSKELCSYSEDPYIDIFKYLKIKKNETVSETLITQENDVIMIKINGLENNNTSRFEIIKGININSVYRGSEPQSFYEFVQDSRTINNGDKFAYAVELYPELPAREKNSKDTPKNIKQSLIEYLRTWVQDTDIDQLMSYVADDKEVVTYGKIEQNLIEIKSEIDYQEITAGTRYQMTFDKNELIYLLLTININNTLDGIIEKIIEKITLDIDTISIDSWIDDVLRKEETQDRQKICGSIAQQITDKKKIGISFQCEISAEFVNNIDNPNVRKCKEKIREYIKKQIKDFLKCRYEKILNSQQQHIVSDFILKFIEKENHKCPQYISEYNEFEPEIGDPEVSILKYIVFKEWNNAN